MFTAFVKRKMILTEKMAIICIIPLYNCTCRWNGLKTVDTHVTLSEMVSILIEIHVSFRNFYVWNKILHERARRLRTVTRQILHVNPCLLLKQNKFLKMYNNNYVLSILLEWTYYVAADSLITTACGWQCMMICQILDSKSNVYRDIFTPILF